MVPQPAGVPSDSQIGSELLTEHSGREGGNVPLLLLPEERDQGEWKPGAQMETRGVGCREYWAGRILLP
jgi:hypothetical protein